MDRSDWGLADLFYGGFALTSLVAGLGVAGYRTAMMGFVCIIGVTDWLEFRTRPDVHSRRWTALTVLVLAALLACLAVPESRLPVYFGGLGAVFFLQAIRQAVDEPDPIMLFRRGYPSLVGISIVCAALADGLIQFRRALIVLLAAVFVFRKCYARW